MAMQDGVTILGIFVADTAYLAPRLPLIGETIIGSGFAVGPGGKGSNQAVAAARAGAQTRLVSKIGRDVFGEIGKRTWDEAGVTPHVVEMDDAVTGAAFIFVNDATGENAIIVCPGAAGTITPADVEAARSAITAARVLVTQLEQPADSALRALRIAREAGVTTLFNPAPAEPFPDEIFALCDFIAPNETEAAALVGFDLDSLDAARAAADALIARGAGAALITLGERGALFHGCGQSVHVPVLDHGDVIDTTGAGDAFVGGFAAALSEGRAPVEAVGFGCATAGIAVTRRGTAASMPSRGEIDAALATATPPPQ